MNISQALEATRRILAQIADGTRPSANDRAAVRVAERHGYIVKDHALMKFTLTTKGRQLVTSGRAHGLI